MKEIIVDSSFNQTRVALLEQKELVELYIEREDNKRTVGNIYKGKITNVLPGMQAAFVDIGFEKNAFLFVKDAIPPDTKDGKDLSIKDVVKNGQDIIVQIVKEPMGTKGARVTTHLTLPGRYLVLMPYVDYIGISRRISNETERERLHKLIEEIKPNNMGVIIRTAGQSKDEKDLKEDLKFLLKLWNKIDKEKNLGFAPKTIFKDVDLLNKTIRDMFTKDIDRLIINDREKYNNVLELLEFLAPHLKDRVEPFGKDQDIFSFYKIEAMIKNALSKKIWLKSGGYIVIDQTEALTSIDVNTGKYVGTIDLEDTVLKTNLEAAKEIAKQLRLRDIGGIIIIDFIDMTTENGEKDVIQLFEEELSKDKTKTNVLGMTQLGLLEMTRKKVKERVNSILEKKCPYCDGTGKVLSEYTVMHSIEKELARTKIHTNAEAILLEVNPTVEALIMEGEESILKGLEQLYGLKIFIKSFNTVHANEFSVVTIGKINKVEKKLQEYNT